MSAALRQRMQVGNDRAALIGISGIDASGKGFICEKLAGQLQAAGCKIAQINADGWLNLPHVRFLPDDEERNSHQASENSAGNHFYSHAIRLEEMFERLILPLSKMRSVNFSMEFTEETATEFRPHLYKFDDIDIILLEGIFIFKRAFVDQFDLMVWIDCDFETALARAIKRGQEGLSKAETADAYQKIYFPAQRIHFDLDDPKNSADIIFHNGK